MPTDIQLSKAQISKINQSGGSFRSLLGNLGEKARTNVYIPLAKDTLNRLISKIASNAIKESERKISGKGVVTSGKEFALFISNDDINDVIKIIKSMEDLSV